MESQSSLEDPVLFIGGDNDPQKETVPWRSNGVLLLLLLLYTLSFIDRTVLSLLIEPIKRDLGLSDVQISLLIGFAFSLFYAFAGFPISFLADRTDRRKLIAVGVGSWSLMTACGSLAGSFATLFVTRMGVGLGEAALSPAAYSLIGDLFPKDKKGRAMAIYTIGAPLGGGLALVLGGLVVQVIAHNPSFVLPVIGPLPSWRVVLLAVGLPGLFLAFLMAATREPARRRDARDPTTVDESTTSIGRFLSANWTVLAPMFLGLALVSGGVYVLLIWTPTLFLRKFGIATASAALPLGIVLSIGGVAGMFVGGWWGDRLWRCGKKTAYARVLAFSVASATPFFIAMPLMPTPILVFACAGVAIFCQCLQAGLPAASLQLLAPEHLRAQSVACLLLVVGLIGPSLGPYLVAMFSEHVFGPRQLDAAMASAMSLLLPLATGAMLLFYRNFSKKVLLHRP